MTSSEKILRKMKRLEKELQNKRKIKKINNRSRMNFLPKHFKNYLHIESMVYYMAERFIQNYDGGMWDFYQIDGMPVMIWEKDKQVKLVNDMNIIRKMNGQTASFCVMLMAIIQSSYQTKNETIQDRLKKQYNSLIDWVLSDDDDTVQEREEFGISSSAVINFLD